MMNINKTDNCIDSNNLQNINDRFKSKIHVKMNSNQSPKVLKSK